MLASRLQLLVILLAVGLVLMRESRRTPSSGVEDRFTDWLVSNTQRDLPPAPAVLVEINDSSLTGGHAWPWSPLDFSLFVQAALPFKPGLIAIEHVLLWDETNPGQEDGRTKHPQYERILLDFLRRSPEVLLGAQLGFPEDPDLMPPLQPMPVLRNVKGSTSEIPEFTVIERQPKEEFRLSPKIGFTNLPAAVAPIRHVPLLLRYRGSVVPSFVLQAVMLWHQVKVDDLQVQVGSHIDLAGKARIPIDAAGGLRVYFKSPFVRFGFDDLLVAAQEREAGRTARIPAEKLHGAIAMLGRTDAPARTLGFPGGVRGSSGELFAAAVATIQSGAYIRRLPEWGDFLILAALLAFSACCSRWSRSAVVQIAAAAFVIYLLIGLAVFSLWLVWLPLLMPFGVLLFAVVFRSVSPNPVRLSGERPQ